jgi:hypothetical protein
MLLATGGAPPKRKDLIYSGDWEESEGAKRRLRVEIVLMRGFGEGVTMKKATNAFEPQAA